MSRWEFSAQYYRGMPFPTLLLHAYVNTARDG